jgi:hypothetical protein
MELADPQVLALGLREGAHLLARGAHSTGGRLR